MFTWGCIFIVVPYRQKSSVIPGGYIRQNSKGMIQIRSEYASLAYALFPYLGPEL
jgi:hypothetical protein